MDRLTSMEAFVRASESGSFVAAAALMGISPQMVAKHIQALEKRLGVRLLHRTTRRQRLTEFGAGYLERCKLILAEVDAADALALAVCHSWRAPMQGRVAALDGHVARSRAGFESKVAAAREVARVNDAGGRGAAADQERARAAARGMARTKGVRW